jgi:N-acetyl-anhydromuramyl-L-alanine amidase AmpD
MKHTLALTLLVSALLAGFTPAQAQQNMADVAYGSGAISMNPAFAASNVPPETNRSHVSAVQQELRARGYRISVDGQYGPQTRKTVMKYQRAQGLAQTGALDADTLTALGVSSY